MRRFFAILVGALFLAGLSMTASVNEASARGAKASCCKKAGKIVVKKRRAVRRGAEWIRTAAINTRTYYGTPIYSAAVYGGRGVYVSGPVRARRCRC